MIAYQLIMQNNGELSVTSQGARKGAIVKFTLEMESLGVISNSASFTESQQLYIEEEQTSSEPIQTLSKPKRAKSHSRHSKRGRFRNQTEGKTSSKQSLINFDIMQSQ